MKTTLMTSLIAAALGLSAGTCFATSLQPFDTPLARAERTEKPQKQEKAGALTEMPTQLAREASEGPRGGNNERPGDRRGGRAFDDHGVGAQLARAERTEKPQKQEKAGMATEVPMQLAREASEGPRGGDNERPGDRQRRGGRGHADDSRATLTV